MDSATNQTMTTGFDAPVSRPRAADYARLNEILAGGPNWDPLPEIKRIYRALSPAAELSFLDGVYKDITAMFAGTYPGFRGAPPCGYHDLRHTRNVALAAMRLLHGLNCRGLSWPEDIVQMALRCACFHDTGMLLRDCDQAEVGTAYLKEHEERSLVFLRQYLLRENLCLDHHENCQAVIDCTNLMTDPRQLTFLCSDQMMIGRVIGTADIMAQMADRYYLERLPILFEEFRSAGIDRYGSAMDLLRQTASFYHEVICKRLDEAFGGVGEAMRDHFRLWWNIDRNLYTDSIQNNIRYLESCLIACDGDESRLAHYLRRVPPAVR